MKRADLWRLRVAYAAWLLGIIAFFIPAATWSPASRFALTRAIVERGTISIDAYASSTGDRAFAHQRWYTEKAPLPSLAAAPPYAVLRVIQLVRGSEPQYRAYAKGRTPAVRMEVNRSYQQGLFVASLFTSGLSGVAVGVLLFELLRRRTTIRAALIASTLVTLGTPLLPYATSLYGHTPAAAFLLAGLTLLDPRRHRGSPPTRRELQIAGACLAAAPGCEYLAALPVSVLVLWFLARSRAKFSTLLDLALGAAIPIALVGLYHSVAFGLPWRTGYSFIVNPEFSAGQQTGLMGITSLRVSALYGLTIGDSRGLFYVAPILVLALAYTCRRAVLRRDWVAQSGLAAFCVLFLLNASYFVWWGGAAAGPRHLVPCLPVFALGLGDALRSRHRALRWLVLALGFVSVLIAVGIASVGIEAPEFQDILGRFVWPNLQAGRVAVLSGASNLGLKLGLPGTSSLLLLTLWGWLGYWYLVAMLRRSPTTRTRGQRAEVEEAKV
jgi:hypothetical protein